MGLAPLGRNHGGQTTDFKGIFNKASLDYSSYMTRFPTNRLLDTSLISPCEKDDVCSPYFTKLAYDIQAESERALLHLAEEAYKLTKCKNLCITGGVALDSVANGKVRMNSKFENIFVMPCPSDTGIALALATYGYYKHAKPKSPKIFAMKNAFTGKNYPEKEISDLLTEQNLPLVKCETKDVANYISQKK